MTFNPFKLEMPDLPQPQGWVDMGQDQPIDAGPAASAFKQRFMTPKPMAKPRIGDALPHAGGGEAVAPHVGSEIPLGGHEAGKDSFKSL